MECLAPFRSPIQITMYGHTKRLSDCDTTWRVGRFFAVVPYIVYVGMR